MRIELKMHGERYEIEIASDYFDSDSDRFEEQFWVYELYGFNPDSIPILLGDSGDDDYDSEAGAAGAALTHLIRITP